jgi:ABC-type transport system involved in multi-copper enzyme maturation permease subunit
MSGSMPGLSGLIRKELLEWRRGFRVWIVLAVSLLFMTLTALNAWLQENLAASQGVDIPPPNMDPLANLGAAVSTQIFVVVTIFAVMSHLVTERESGTLAWTASKPVSRSGIWLAKWLSATGILWVAAAVVPLLATVAIVYALYGPVPVVLIAFAALGMALSIALFGAVVLAASTVITSQAAVAAIGLAAIFRPMVLAGIVPIGPYLPTSIMEWALLTGAGQSAGFVTPIVWAITVLVLVGLSFRQMERMEL